MDYKYIEQLLERYWECQTTLEEEAILRKFFAQTDIPASLLPYRDLFMAEEQMSQTHLGEDFDEKLMNRIEKAEGNVAKTLHHSITSSSPRSISFSDRLRPLWRAAAVVAIVLTIGMAAQQGFQKEGEEGTISDRHIAAQSDTIELFTDQPELSPQTEAVLTPTQTDTLNIITP